MHPSPRAETSSGPNARFSMSAKVERLKLPATERILQNMNPRSPSESEVPPLRERIRLATSAAILAAAEEVFAAEGLEKARMNDIAARAGVAVGTLYNHFKDRDDLLAGLLTVRREELLELMERAYEAPGLAFRDRLKHVLSTFLAYIYACQPFH